MKYIQEFCQDKLNTINSVSSDDKDLQIIKDSVTEGSKNSIASCLAKLRVQERAALLQTLSKVQEELSTLSPSAGVDPREYYQERRLRELNLLRPLVCT